MVGLYTHVYDVYGTYLVVAIRYIVYLYRFTILYEHAIDASACFLQSHIELSGRPHSDHRTYCCAYSYLHC